MMAVEVTADEAVSFGRTEESADFFLPCVTMRAVYGDDVKKTIVERDCDADCF